ncbi:MAG TPA: class I SAM-dependent methyltransferase [Anaerolineales bacterium]|nr:class I SAM-dependent methyltransferase [Anaerolineales bacterium]
MQNKNDYILKEVAGYYSEKLAKYGETPHGVDWNGDESQILRFKQLCKIITLPGNFSVNDLGCGYGALFEFLGKEYSDISYLGVDVSLDMTNSARRRYEEYPHANFINAEAPDRISDFGIASGIFNVRLGCGDSEWYAYILSTLDILNKTSRLGFSFNCLTSYSDEDKKKDYLFYADPSALFDFCKRKFSRQVALLHDYGLYEFTILVRR